MGTRIEFDNGREMADFMKGLRPEQSNSKSSQKSRPTQLNMEPVEPDQELDCLEDNFHSQVDIFQHDFKYDPVERTYRIEGKYYKEGQMIAFAVDEGVYLMNFDPIQDKWFNQQLAPHHKSALTAYRVTHKHPKLDPVYRQFYECARRKNYPCFIVWCQDGKLIVPCYSFVDEQRGLEECIACLFNAAPCEYWHRRMLCAVEVQVGELCERMFITYYRGAELKWPEFVNAKVEEAQQEDANFTLYRDTTNFISYPSYIRVKQPKKSPV